MKSSAKKIELASVDDLFSTEESRADAQRERVLEIPFTKRPHNSHHALSFGNVNPYCVHFVYTSLSDSILNWRPSFSHYRFKLLSHTNILYFSGSTCLNRPLQRKDG